MSSGQPLLLQVLNLHTYLECLVKKSTLRKNNAKVFLIYGVFWAVAARSIARRSDPFLRDLGIMAVFYLLIAYPVIYIRELRHFLPLAIVVLPAALAELERHAGVQKAAASL